jgi:hypothetical protein
MVPKWSGTNKAVPLHELFEILESTARVGICAQDDLITIAAMSLTHRCPAECNMSSRKRKPQTGTIEPSGTGRTDVCSYNDSCKNAPAPMLVDFHFIRIQTQHNTLLYFTKLSQNF